MTNGTANIEVTVAEITLQTVIGSIYDDEGPSRPLTVGDRVAEILAEKFAHGDDWSSLRHRIANVTDEEIRARVTPLIEETLNKGFPKPGAYGAPTKVTTNLAEIIQEHVTKFLTNPVGGGYGSTETALQKMVREAVSQQFAKVVNDQVSAAKKEVAAQVAEVVKNRIISQLGK